MICVTALGIAQQEAAKSYRPYIGDGHAADSPQNEPRTGAPGRHPASGQYASEIAAGHHVAGTPSMDYQPGLSPAPAAQLATSSGGETALASPITANQGTAIVHRFDAASAASPGLAGQLGRNTPSGIPGQPPVHVAPTGVGAQFRVSPPRPPEAWMIPPPATGGF